MKDSINKRITYLIQLLAGGHSSKFARSLDIPPGQMNNYTGKRQSQPGYDVLARICRVYPHLNERWLILGEGDIEKSAARPLLAENNNEYSSQLQLEARYGALKDSFNSNIDSFKIALPENNPNHQIEVLKKEVEGLRRELEGKDEIIWSKEEIIRSKEEIIQAKDEVINHLKNSRM